MLPYVLRPMRREDIPQVAEIEKEAFPSLWPATSLKRELERPQARYLVVVKSDGNGAQPAPEPPSLPGHQPWYLRLVRGLRAPLGPRQPLIPTSELIAGYVGIWFMTDEAHIVSIAVRESCRGLGLGELLLMGSIEISMGRGARVVTLEVRVSNQPAQALYEKYRFRRVGVRKRYYADNHEDAAIMNTDPITTPEYAELFHRLKEEFRQRRGDALMTTLV